MDQDDELATQIDLEQAVYDDDDDDDDISPISDNAEDREIDFSVGGVDAWKRADPVNINENRSAISIMQMDCDYMVGPAMQCPGLASPTTNQLVPIVRFFGVSKEGHSACVNVFGVQPYFYVEMPRQIMDPQQIAALRESLTNALLCAKAVPEFVAQPITGIEVVSKTTIWEYQFDEKKRYFKIFVAIPKLVATCRRIFEKDGILIRGQRLFLRCFEANLPFALRFMVDHKIQGGSWLSFAPGTYRLRSGKEKHTRCQLEINVAANCVEAHQPHGLYQNIADLRILSFDIECAGRKGKFPEPKIDPVIQIANVVTIQGQDHPIIKNVFTLKSCSPIVGARVISYDTEEEMLAHWADFVLISDPDILTGYNIINFDLVYLLERAATLKIESFSRLGRVIGECSKIRSSKFSSRAYGIRENKEFNISGRVQFDVLQAIRRDYKLSSYTLNAVSARFLNKCKDDVHHSIITDLQNGDSETRRRLAEYCIKDALLPQLLLDKLMLVVNYIEMSRVTGVPFSYLLSRGQQIKVVSQLYRKAAEHDMIIPMISKQKIDQTYEGATVIEPIKGFYKEPISTLDFASLYPSIMMAHNLCYTSLVTSKEALSKLSPDQYEVTPGGHSFVKSSLQRGLLPEILFELLEARRKAKKDLKAATDPFQKAVLNGRQLALKISANSVYGFTGATIGQLPCLAISSSVTAFGRQMIDLTKKIVQEHYTIKNGYEHDALVIYGDTDSVMVKFGIENIQKAIELGQEAAEFVSRQFTKPISLEFEKVYSPMLLMNKKRYAGLLWTDSKHWSKLDAKGIETVRRDNCALVRNMVDVSLHKILMDADPTGAVDYCKYMINDLLCNRLDLSLLVVTKALAKEDYKAKQAHVELADRMRKRDPLSAPVIGDRVPYVILQGAKGQVAYERAEDPLFVLENSLPIDFQYYLHNQLEKPLRRIFEPVLGQKVSSLFTGDHTRVVKTKLPSGSNKGMFKFTQRQNTCPGCKCRLPQEHKGVCEGCRNEEPIHFARKIANVFVQEKEFNETWTECQRCQESTIEEVLCSNKDCPVFYRRKKAQMDLKEALDRLNNQFGW